MSSQIVYMRGGDRDGEVDTSETALPEVAAQAVSVVIPVVPSRWNGQGNALGAAGVMLLDLLAGLG